MAKVPNGVGHC